MPVVPRSQLTQSLNGAPNFRQSDATAGLIASNPNARQMQQAGAGLVQAGNQIDLYQKEQDEAEALNADASTRESYLEFQNEARKRKGLSATGLAEDTKKWWDETARKNMEVLKNDRQKQLYIKRLQGVRLSSIESMGQYQEQQVRVAKQEGALSSMSGSVNLALADVSNEGLRNEAIENIRKTTFALGAENGDAPETIEKD